MPTDKRQRQQSSERPWIHPRDLKGLYALVASALVLSISYWFYLGGHQGQLIEIDRASPLEARFVVDVNQADWPEIIQLPALGEILAQRIIADREQNGPFRNLDDLTRVNGIGPKTLEKIRPYLMPIPQDTDWAAVEDGELLPVQ